jgi:uncharacterized protein YjbI with pentapeptide repeats
MNRRKLVRRFDELTYPAYALAFASKLAATALMVAIVVGLVAAVQLTPEWQLRRAGVHSTAANSAANVAPSDRANLENELRKTLIQVVGGAFALVALYLTFRRVRVAEQGHITERYTRAIEQLGAISIDGKPNLEVRLGAIYALERIAVDSPRDHWNIMEVLTAYVRHNAQLGTNAFFGEDVGSQAAEIGPSAEIQAILTVLGRRRRGRRRERTLHRLNLSDCDLRGARLEWAHLERARFNRTRLEGAHFYHAHLRLARFRHAKLDSANFLGARAEGASFYRSVARFAHFNLAYLEGVGFDEVDLTGASFWQARVEGAYFKGCIGLTEEQMKSADGWDSRQITPSN